MKLKNVIPIAALVVLLLSAFVSQTADNNNTPEQPYISVTGSAEKEVIPNEIYLVITLKEFMDGKDKVTLEKLEKQLVKAVEGAGIDAKQLGIGNVNSQLLNYKRKQRDVFEQRTYQLKITGADKMAAFFNNIQDIEISSLNVARVSHSEIEAYRKEVKMAAAKAAKDKAGYLLEAMDAKVGKPLEVIESPVNINYFSRGTVSNVSLSGDKFSEDYESNIDFQPIILRYDIQARFAIE